MKKINDQPDDGEDSGIPGDAWELLCLADKLNTEIENQEKVLKGGARQET